jgi:hypothetical protein
MTEPRKTTRSRTASGASGEPAASEPVPAAPTPPPAAPTPPSPPTPPPTPTAAPTPPAPPPAAAAAAAAPPPAESAPEGPPPGAQVAAAITGVASTLKQRLSGPELLLGGGALLILGLSYVVFGFLFDSLRPTELSVVTAAALLLFIGLERTQTEGFGTWYKVILVLLGAILLLGAAYSFLNWLRAGFSGFDLFDWLSALSWWAGGVIAGLGSWLSYRVRV